MSIWAIIPLITSIAYLVILTFSLPYLRRRRNILFGIYVAVAGFWSFSSFQLHLEAPPARTLLWNQILVVALVWTLFAWFHFILSYCGRTGRRWVYFGYSFLLVLAVLTFSGRIVQYSYVADGVLHHSLGNSIFLIGAISLVFVGASLYLLLKNYRQSLDPIDRNRTLYLVTGWSVLTLFSYSNLVPALAEMPLDHIGSLINALLISYAVSKFSLLDMKLVVRRGLAYTILGLGFLAAFGTAVFVGRVFFPDYSFNTFVLAGTTLVLLLALVTRPLRVSIQEAVDRFFYRDTYTYREALVGFSTDMAKVINLDELADRMLPAICKALRITQVALLFEDESSGDFTEHFVYPKTLDGTTDRLSFNRDNPILAWLEKEDKHLDVGAMFTIPQFMGLWEVERAKLTSSNTQVLCPVKSRGKLIGILALGKKVRTGLYTHEDIELVMGMASQAGIVVENARLYALATLKANIDGLTGLYNHRHLQERLEQEIARSARSGTDSSLIMLDLDFFKTFNDIYGHLAGDMALQRVAGCIRNSIRSMDVAFRYGGEEFAVLLPETNLDDAYRVAERIRTTIESNASFKTVPITASVGVTSWAGIGHVRREDVIANADAALYEAKERGRNKTCVPTDLIKPELTPVTVEVITKARAASVIYALAATVDAKDHYTYGHSKKVSQFAQALAAELGLPQEKVALLRAAGLLHDIGKIAVPDSILSKASPLTEEEWEAIREHPKLGADILRHVTDLLNCLPAITHHHERFDGTGYPQGLKGTDIPLEARLLCVADAYDAITSTRAYRVKMTPEQALVELERFSGTQFDPELVKAFCRLMRASNEIALTTVTRAKDH